MSKELWLIIAAIALLLSPLIAMDIDRATADIAPVGSGVVLEKVYSGASSSTGVGFAPNGNGVGPVVVRNYIPEEWVVIVRHGASTFSVKVDSSDWGDIEEGLDVEVLEVRGTIWNWGKVIKFKR
jgi:hypothetical protein